MSLPGRMGYRLCSKVWTRNRRLRNPGRCVLCTIATVLAALALVASALYLGTVIRAKVSVHIGQSGELQADTFDRASLKRRALYEVGKESSASAARGPATAARSKTAVGEDFPRVIHQLWKTADIPDRFREAVSACRRLNPTWQYRLWTDRSIDDFIAGKYPLFYERFVSYKYPIQRVDVARYFILLHYGGVTIDIDLKCRVPLDDILRDKAGYELVVPETDPAGVTVEFMAAKSRGRFLRQVAFDLNKTPPDYILPYITVIFSTGPMYLTNKLVDYPNYDEIFVIPQKTYREEYFSNLHGGSWHRWDFVLIKILYAMVSPLFVVGAACLVCAYAVYRRRQKRAKEALTV